VLLALFFYFSSSLRSHSVPCGAKNHWFFGYVLFWCFKLPPIQF